MIEAHRVTVAMDVATTRDDLKATAAALSHGRCVYSQFLELLATVKMTQPEAHALQNTLDLIRTRLRFFGESV